MNIISDLFGRLSQSLQTSMPTPQDANISLPPHIQPILELGSPLSFGFPGQVQNSSFVTQVNRAILNGVGQTDVIATLTKGIWRVHICFAAVQDFAGLAAGARILLQDPVSLVQSPIIQVMGVANVPALLIWHETIYVPAQGLTFQVNTPAAGAAQNTVTSTEMVAHKIL